MDFEIIIPIGIMKLELTTARDFGSLIRTARKRAGLTLIECAGANGVGVRFLSELERGKETAALGLSLRVAHSLGIRIRASLPQGE